MKQNGLTYKLMAVALVGIAILLAAVWICEPRLLSDSLPIRLALVASLVAAAGGFVALALAQRRRDHEALKRYIHRICQLEPHELANELSSPSMPLPDKRHPWREIFEPLRQYIETFSRRLADAEHARTSADVRMKRLVYERQQMAEILAGLSDPVVAIDHYDELVLANTSAERLFGIDNDRTAQQALDDLVKCEELVELLRETRRKRAPATRTAEISVAASDGSPRAYRVSCSSITTLAEVGTPDEHGVVAVLNDISNEKAMQRRNAEFVSAVSHEMKTPLAGIKAYVELLADGDAEDEETREEFLQVINSQTDRLQRLVENLLNLARIEAGVVDVKKELRSLNELLDEAAEIVQPASEQKNIRLNRELSPMYLGVLADRDMILQAAINLLSNAIKYTPSGGCVTLRSRLEDSDVVFEVEDTGVGLCEEDRQRVFDKFYRVKKDREMAAGTGLGLPLAKHIVEDVHGGRLTVDSEPGKGSTFRVTLPGSGKLNR